MPSTFTPVNPPLPPVVVPTPPHERPAAPSVRDKAAHVLAGVSCAVGAVVTFWGLTVAWDGALWGLVAACAVATAGLGLGAGWLLVWPLLLDVRHGLRDLDGRDNHAYDTQRFHRRQDRVLSQAAAHLYTRHQPDDTRVVNGRTAAQVVRAELEQEIAAVRTELRTARYVPPDAVPLARVPTLYQERVTERLPPQHTPYSADQRLVVEWATSGQKWSQAACQARGLPKGRWSEATAALWAVGVLVKGDKPNDPYQLAPWAKTAALVSRALTGEE